MVAILPSFKYVITATLSWVCRRTVVRYRSMASEDWPGETGWRYPPVRSGTGKSRSGVVCWSSRLAGVEHVWCLNMYFPYSDHDYTSTSIWIKKRIALLVFAFTRARVRNFPCIWEISVIRHCQKIVNRSIISVCYGLSRSSSWVLMVLASNNRDQWMFRRKLYNKN